VFEFVLQVAYGGGEVQTHRLDSLEVILIEYRHYNSILDVLFKVEIWFLKQIGCRGERELLEPCALVSLVVKLLTL
jgi:hypothetical protein